MLKIANVFLLLLATFCVNAQINNFSPYSRFGLGDLQQDFSLSGIAMGGTGIALRTPNQVNHLNPASYNAQDTFSFVFDVGTIISNRVYATEEKEYTYNTSNLNHIALSFPVTKWWYASAGLLPYTSVNYKYNSGIQSIDKDAEYFVEKVYEGAGGLSQLYVGTAFKIGNFLSLGINGNYTFGRINFSNVGILKDSTGFYETGQYIDVVGAGNNKYEEVIEVKNFIPTLGLQAYKTFNNHYFSLGAIYEPTIKLNATHSFNNLYENPYGLYDTVNSSANDEVEINLPYKFGVGLTYAFKSKVLVTCDYDFRDWSKFKLDAFSQNLNTAENLRFGIEYTPNKKTLKRNTFKSYIERVSFRAGGYFLNSYVKYENTDIKDKGMTFGLSLPLGNNKTVFNIAYIRGIRGTTNYGLVEETYNQIRIGVSLYDNWFYRSKYD